MIDRPALRNRTAAGYPRDLPGIIISRSHLAGCSSCSSTSLDESRRVRAGYTRVQTLHAAYKLRSCDRERERSSLPIFPIPLFLPTRGSSIRSLI